MSGATSNDTYGVVAGASQHGNNHGGKGDHKKCKDDHGRHRSVGVAEGKDKGKKCKPEPKPTTTVAPTTVPEEPTTVPEEPTTVPEEPTTVPDEPVVEGKTTVVDEPTTAVAETPAEPEVLGVSQTSDVEETELAFTGVSNSGLIAAGIGMLLMGLALVTGTSQRRRLD